MGKNQSKKDIEDERRRENKNEKGKNGMKRSGAQKRERGNHKVRGKWNV